MIVWKSMRACRRGILDNEDPAVGRGVPLYPLSPHIERAAFQLQSIAIDRGRTQYRAERTEVRAHVHFRSAQWSTYRSLDTESPRSRGGWGRRGAIRTGP